jgi:hypothetical protein
MGSRLGSRAVSLAITVALTVDYATTADMADGQPLPPYIDDDGAVWRIVRRLPDARTCWCRIRLAGQTTKQITKTRAVGRRQAARPLGSRNTDWVMGAPWRQSRQGSAKRHDTKIHAQDKTKAKES